MIYLLFHLFAFASLTEAAISSCYKDNFGWALDNHCFEIVFKDMNWYDARNYCASRGGDLAEIRTQRIQDSIVQHLKMNNGGKNGFWFGATDGEIEGHWLWLHSPRGMAYSHWNPSQGPNDHGFLIGGSLEDCAMIRTDDGYRWHDGPCDGVINNLDYSFICQYDYKPLPKATTLNWLTHKPTTYVWKTQKPTTYEWKTQKPTTYEWKTQKPTTYVWKTQKPTTYVWKTQKPTTYVWKTQKPTTYEWTTQKPTSYEWTTQKPTTYEWTTQKPTTTTEESSGVIIG